MIVFDADEACAQQYLKANPLPEFDFSDLPLFKSIIQQQEMAIPGLLGAPPADVKQSETHYATRDGIQMHVKLYQPSTPPGIGSPMIVMFHAGGWCTGIPEMEEIACRNLVQAFDAVCVSCSYRLAPEFKFPTGVLDAWDALQWAAENAESFGADPVQGFILGGTSAGANFTAVLSHMARDKEMQPSLTGLYHGCPALGMGQSLVVPERYKDRNISFVQNEHAPLISKAACEMLENGYAPDATDHELCKYQACCLWILSLPIRLLTLCRYCDCSSQRAR